MAIQLDLGRHDLLRPSDTLYRWVADQYVVEGKVLEANWPASQWRNGLSCDWSVLARAEQTAKRLGGSLPAFVLQFTMQGCLDLGIDVRHCPVIDESSPDYNLAHCLLFPPETGKAAIRKLRDELQEKATLLRIRRSLLHPFFAVVHNWNPRYRSAVKHIRDSTPK